MRNHSIGIALLVLMAGPALPAGPVAHASGSYCLGSHCKGNRGFVRFADHQYPGDARIAITTEDGKVTLLLTDRHVAFQLSDRTLRRVDRELRDSKEEQNNWFASAIATAVGATVRELIDHSLVCRVQDLRDVSYQDGRLEFRARDGRLIFDRAEVDDRDVCSAFSERDARSFVREFRRLKAGH